MQREKSNGGMGFRCFETMNNAMLMKQLWRILKNPDLLISRIFKQKYFRNDSFLEVTPKQGSSFAWKNITGVLEMFKAGLELDTDNEWKWRFTASGIYSVKSGYEWNSKWKSLWQTDYGEVSDWSGTTKVMISFWRLRLPNRVKLVMWRLLHNSLPVFANLMSRGCTDIKGCGFCGFKMEDVVHSFINCWWTKSFWTNLGIMNKPWQSEVNWSISDWVWFILSNEDPKIIKLMCIGIWMIWQNRNLAVHGKEPHSIANSCFRTEQCFHQFKCEVYQV